MNTETINEDIKIVDAIERDDKRLLIAGIFIGGPIEGVGVPENALWIYKHENAEFTDMVMGNFSQNREKTEEINTYVPFFTQTQSINCVHFLLRPTDMDAATLKAISFHKHCQSIVESA